MSLQRTMRGAMTLTGGQGITYALIFVRNAIVARILGPSEFGLAGILIVTATFLEIMSSVGLAEMTVQSRGGGRHAFQRVVHGALATRGILIAAILFFFASWFAWGFKVPEMTWAFRLFAVIPLIKGFGHNDLLRFQRHQRFFPTVQIDVTSQLLPTLLAWPLVVWIGNFSVVVWLMIAQTLTQVVLSHVMATRRFRVSWDRKILVSIWAFGWPLLVNGIFMFFVSQGDRAIVAVSFDASSLGLYMVASGLTMLPAMMLMKIAGGTLLPVFSRVQDNKPRVQNLHQRVARLYVMAGVAISVLFILGGQAIITQIYGQDYAPAGPLLIWLGAAQALYLIHGENTMVAMARGDTKTSLFSSIARGVGTLVILLAVMDGKPLEWVAMGVFAGEVMRLATTTYRLKSAHGMPLRTMLEPLAIGVVCVLVCIYLVAPQLNVLGPWVIVCGAIGTVGLLLLLAVAASHSLRQDIRLLASAGRNSL